MLIIDGENCILGRLSSYVAKELLKGEVVRVVNAEKIFILGDPVKTVGRYKQRRGLREIAKPEKSPKFPRRPDLFVKKTIKGMLPKSKRGDDASRRVKAHIGVPKEFEGKGEKIAELKDMRKKKITILELCKKLGWGA